MTVLDPREATMDMTRSLPLISLYFSKNKDFIKKKIAIQSCEFNVRGM